MPARKSARKSRSKSFKRCSRLRETKCRSRKSCGYSSRRTPKCQPKKSRRASRKRSSRGRSRTSSKRMKKVSKGALMSKPEVEGFVKAVKCRTTRGTDGKCDDDCLYDPRQKTCVPTISGDNPAGRFMDGTRYLTFRSGRKPAFSFKIPINMETLIGDYAGAIRWSPATGKLHLCYGPIVNRNESSNRPLLSMLVKEKIVKDLWEWYTNHGLAMQKKRITETPADQLVYAELYALPGASVQLSWSECMFLEDLIENNKDKIKDEGDRSKGLMLLAEAPKMCPMITDQKFATSTGCLPLNTPGNRYTTEAASYSAYRRQYNDDRYDAYAVLGGRPKASEREKMLDEFGFEDDDDETPCARKKMRPVSRKASPKIPKKYAQVAEKEKIGLTPILGEVFDKSMPYRTNPRGGTPAVSVASKKQTHAGLAEDTVVGEDTFESIVTGSMVTGSLDDDTYSCETARVQTGEPHSEAESDGPRDVDNPLPVGATSARLLKDGSAVQMYHRLTDLGHAGNTYEHLHQLTSPSLKDFMQTRPKHVFKSQNYAGIDGVYYEALESICGSIDDAASISLNNLPGAMYHESGSSVDAEQGDVSHLTANPGNGTSGSVLRPAIVMKSLISHAGEGEDKLMTAISGCIVAIVSNLKKMWDKLGETKTQSTGQINMSGAAEFADIVAARINLRILRAAVFDLSQKDGVPLGGYVNGIATNFVHAFPIPDLEATYQIDKEKHMKMREEYTGWFDFAKAFARQEFQGGQRKTQGNFLGQKGQEKHGILMADFWQNLSAIFDVTTGNSFAGDRAELKMMRYNNQDREKLYKFNKQLARQTRVQGYQQRRDQKNQIERLTSQFRQESRRIEKQRQQQQRQLEQTPQQRQQQQRQQRNFRGRYQESYSDSSSESEGER